MKYSLFKGEKTMKVRFNSLTKNIQEEKQNLDRIQGSLIAPFLLEMHIPF